MGKILQGRYDRLLRRTTAQVGFGSKVGEALEDLFPVLDVESGPMELLRAAGWKFGTTFIERTSAVGTINSQQLFNPVDSGHLVVLTSLFVLSDTADIVHFGPSFNALIDGQSLGAERDTRAGEIRRTVAVVQRQDNGTPSLFGVIRAEANIVFEITDQNGVAVLAPGTGYRISHATLNTTLRTWYLWRERVAEPEELNF